MIGQAWRMMSRLRNWCRKTSISPPPREAALDMGAESTTGMNTTM
jgi:hypothetical protein